MTSAIFSLVGVVIGGLLTAAVQVLQQQRSDRAELRAGSRLLSAELSEQHLFLDSLANDTRDKRTTAALPAITAWPDFRRLMARLLDDETWQAVAGAYAELGLMHSEAALDLPSLDVRVQDARLRLQRQWRAR